LSKVNAVMTDFEIAITIMLVVLNKPVEMRHGEPLPINLQTIVFKDLKDVPHKCW